jgi:hypothetical protein
MVIIFLVRASMNVGLGTPTYNDLQAASKEFCDIKKDYFN